MNLTAAQQRAVDARGNVLVTAAAGTGKTLTLIERCLSCLCGDAPRVSLDEILVVTFTDAAAAEMRKRLRARLEEQRQAHPRDTHWAEQLALFDTAHIGTLHSFCLKLVRQHFYELELDPQLSVLDEGEARLLANEALETVFQRHYAGQDEASEAVRQLVQIQAGGRDDKLRALVLRLHGYEQTRANPDAWFQAQSKMFISPEPAAWQRWLLEGIAEWRERWLQGLDPLADGNEKAAECGEILRALPATPSREAAAEILERMQQAGVTWPPRRKTKLEPPLKAFFAEARFLKSLAVAAAGTDPLAEDWNWVRQPMATLLRLTREFTGQFSDAKREQGVVDFHDLEQHALRLLWDFGAEQPTKIANRWRQQIRFVFVDEYQDINAAQDKIITALSREGAEANRFLVGDVKQSIYRFRLADPSIFRSYAHAWRDQRGQTIPLVENFRSREGILDFANSLFGLLMCEEIGGVEYDDQARLQSGAKDKSRPPEDRSEPRVELLLRLKGNSSSDREADSEPETAMTDPAGPEEAEKEARMVALQLRELRAQEHQIWDEKQSCSRVADWRDMAVLLRAPANKAESYARAFERAQVPLVVERGGFYQTTEVSDLLCLLQLLDNPLQDVPALAVLRSPLVGLSLDELAAVRLAQPRGYFWKAFVKSVVSSLQSAADDTGVQPRTAGGGAVVFQDLLKKSELFLDRFKRWRRLARQAPLSRCLETVLAETHYDDWLRAQPRGAQRHANIERFLNLAGQFDLFQRQGLFRFLRFIRAQQEAEAEPEVAPVAGEDAVRLMSIHQSKGLEFPVVVLADLGKRFNEADLRADIMLDERFGLCPHVNPPGVGRRYPSLPYWLARQRQRRELWGEELRLLYVAMTRARDTLMLAGSVSSKQFESRWQQHGAVTPQAVLAANSYADWLGLWFARQAGTPDAAAGQGVLTHLRWRFMPDEGLSDEAEVSSRSPAVPVPMLDERVAARLLSVLKRSYPHKAATKWKAKSSVTALRRQAKEADEEAEAVFTPRNFRQWTKKSARRSLSAAEIGTAHHKFLQHFALEHADKTAALREEAARLEQAGVLTPEEAAALDIPAMAAFWQSELGRKFRAEAAFVRRELAFTARFTPVELATIAGVKPEPALDDEFVVVQGVADLVVLRSAEIWLVDFKTDAVSPRELEASKQSYAPQLRLYARALTRIYARPVSECWLHFLACAKTVPVES